MSGQLVYVAKLTARESRHECNPPDLWSGLPCGPGTVWLCDCGRPWVTRDECFGNRWVRVRWFHFGAKRKIRDWKYGVARYGGGTLKPPILEPGVARALMKLQRDTL